MNKVIKHRRDIATEGEIVDHLIKCDESFTPRLSQRIDLMEYGIKIHNAAVRFEAWSNSILVGLVAAYCNDPQQKQAYITSVSVLDEWMGKGIASKLLGDCIVYIESLGFQRIGLEVENKNVNAINLYKKNRFVADKVDGLITTMCLEIGDIK